MNVVEPGKFIATNHHSLEKDDYDRYMKRCMITKMGNGKSRQEAYSVCSQEYKSKKQTKVIKNNGKTDV